MWLVQRCKPKRTYTEGTKVSDYMDLDYMGSAEFEFGAIPKSIRRLAGKPNLVVRPVKYTNAKHHNFTYYVLADETFTPASKSITPVATDMERAIDAIKTYIEGKNGAGRLKEFIRFKDVLIESEFQGSNPETFWWCVDEGIDHQGNMPEKVNFCFTFDPEQARCFKLALAASVKFMDAKK